MNGRCSPARTAACWLWYPSGHRRLAAARTRAGVSLIELLMVVVIVGMLVKFAAPKIDMTRFRMNSVVQLLGNSILAAQRQAVTQQHDVVVFIDSASRRLRILEDRNNNAVINSGEHVRFVSFGEGVVFGRGPAPAGAPGSAVIAITRRLSGVPVLVFHRDGSASEQGGFYVTSAQAQRGNVRATDARAVTVDRATGRASWYRYGTSGWVTLF